MVQVASVPMIVDGVHDVPPLDHLTERGEALLVQHRAVLEVNKHLGEMRVWSVGSGMWRERVQGVGCRVRGVQLRM